VCRTRRALVERRRADRGLHDRSPAAHLAGLLGLLADRDALVFETTARSVNEVIPPRGNLLYHACVVKAGAAQAYDLVLNSEEL
jgi:hypothetical protein